MHRSCRTEPALGLTILAAVLLITAWLAACCRGEWIDVPATRDSGISGLLGELEDRMPAGHVYRDGDKVTWAHETTHGLNSRIRNRRAVTGSINAFYVFGGKACVLPEPDLMLADVARAVPAGRRGPLYRLYLVEQQRSWNDCPLYVLDELTAYANGAAIGIELGLIGRAAESLRNAREMHGYAIILATLTEQAGYIEQHDLEHFLYTADVYLSRLASYLQGA